MARADTIGDRPAPNNLLGESAIAQQPFTIVDKIRSKWNDYQGTNLAVWSKHDKNRHTVDSLCDGGRFDRFPASADHTRFCKARLLEAHLWRPIQRARFEGQTVTRWKRPRICDPRPNPGSGATPAL